MAIGPFARILAQLVVPVIAVLARAIPAAYGQALQNARKAGVGAAEASAPVFGKRISRSEALQVLNLAEKEATPEAIQKVSAGFLFIWYIYSLYICNNNTKRDEWAQELILSIFVFSFFLSFFL
jgi:hypothetical protein